MLGRNQTVVLFVTTLFVGVLQFTDTYWVKRVVDNYLSSQIAKSYAVRTYECPEPKLEERYKFYVGNRYCNHSVPVEVHEHCDIPLCVKPSASPLLRRLDSFHMYYDELTERIKRPALAMFGDRRDVQLSCPVLVKARLSGKRHNILMKMEIARHFGPVKISNVFDTIPFSEKEDIAIWNGATTGGTGDDSQRWAILNRIQSLRHNPLFDVRVAAYVQNQGRTNEFGTTKQRSVRDSLRYKMLIDAEGNDVSSGLKWKLASSSVVIMPTPTISSWAAEELLEPWVHYIPVRQDFMDLEKAVDWCLSHLDECEQIGANGRCWMQQFLDEELEKAMIGRVLAMSTPCTELFSI